MYSPALSEVLHSGCSLLTYRCLLTVDLALAAMNLMLARIFTDFTLVLDDSTKAVEVCMFSVKLESVQVTFARR